MFSPRITRIVDSFIKLDGFFSGGQTWRQFIVAQKFVSIRVIRGEISCHKSSPADV